MNEMLSCASAGKAESGTSTSPVAQVVNENLPARKPKARRFVSESAKRMITMCFGHPIRSSRTKPDAVSPTPHWRDWKPCVTLYVASCRRLSTERVSPWRGNRTTCNCQTLSFARQVASQQMSALICCRSSRSWISSSQARTIWGVARFLFL
jgi:hypothetical protein